MHEFRRFVSGPLGKILLAVIILPFVISGFYGYFSGSRKGNSVAKVDGTPIYSQTLSKQVQRYRAAVSKQRPDLDPKLIQKFVNPGMVLQGLINNQLILSLARDSNMRVTNEEAVSEIRQAPAFRNKQGQFDKQAFEATVRNMGTSEQGYINDLRKDLLIDQVRTGFSATEFALPHELEQQQRLSGQTRNIRYAEVPVDSVMKQFKISDDEISKYYKQNSSQFMTPKKYKVSWVELSPDHFRDQVSVTEADIKKEYQARKQVLQQVAGQREQRKAADIMIKIGDKHSKEEALKIAKNLREKIEKGANFSAMAKKYSEDPSTAPQGGDLGMVEHGMLPDKMEQTLFSMKEGQVSQPVVTDQGVHLLKLEKIKQAKAPSLADMHDRIKTDLIKGRLDAKVNEAASKLDDLAFEHSDLTTPAKKLGLKIHTSDWFALNDPPKGVLSNKKVQSALQSQSVMQQGHNSQMLDLGKNRYAVIHLADQKPSKPIPLDQVRNDIRQRLQRQKALQKIGDMADAARKQAGNGKDLEALAKEWGVKVAKAEKISRDDDKLDSQLVSQAFTMPKPKDGKPGAPGVVRTSDGGLAAVTVTDVTDGKVGNMQGRQEKMQLAQMANQEGQRTFREIMAWLHDKADIEINKSALQNQESDDNPD